MIRKIKWKEHVEGLKFQGINSHQPLSFSDDDEDEDSDNGKVCVLESQNGKIMGISEQKQAHLFYDLWDMMTNFNVTPEVMTAIINTDGVETADVFSRYHVKIGFSKASGLFDTENCKQKVENNIMALFEPSKHVLDQQEIFSNDIQEEIEKELTHLKKGRFWGMYVAPNGVMDTISCDEQDSLFIKKCRVYRHAQALVGGSVYICPVFGV